MEGTEKIYSSETLTVRINGFYLERLRQESSEKEITLNTLMNQIVKHYIYWYSPAPKAGFLPVRRQLVERLFGRYTEQEIQELGQDIAKTHTKDLLLLVGNNYNIIAAIEMMETWIRASGFSFQRLINGNNYSCAIEHCMGNKWSLYLTEILRAIFLEFNLKPIFKSTSNILRVEFELY